MNQIFARKVTIVQKRGTLRLDYTHVTEFNVYIDSKLGPTLNIRGETDDGFYGRYIAIDKYPIKDIELTIIEWYIPPV